MTTEEKAIEIRSGIDTLILKGKNEIKWADESDKKTNIYAISASSSSFLIKGNSREDSLTVTLPGTTAGISTLMPFQWENVKSVTAR